MKRIAIVVGLVSLFTFCKKTKEDVKELLDVTFSFSVKNDFSLPKISGVERSVPDSVISVKTPGIANSMPDEFKKNNANIDKLKSIKVEGVVLNIKSPSSQTFAFMKSIKIFMGADGIGETLLASKSNINSISPASGTLSLDTQGGDISAYIKNPTYYIRTETSIVKTYTSDITVGSDIKFQVVANALN